MVESNGTVTFAYAGVEPIVAGKAIATLEFQANGTGDTEVTVQHQQVNDLTPAYDETVPIDFAHPNTELRDAGRCLRHKEILRSGWSRMQSGPERRRRSM